MLFLPVIKHFDDREDIYLPASCKVFLLIFFHSVLELSLIFIRNFISFLYGKVYEGYKIYMKILLVLSPEGDRVINLMEGYKNVLLMVKIWWCRYFVTFLQLLHEIFFYYYWYIILLIYFTINNFRFSACYLDLNYIILR